MNEPFSVTEDLASPVPAVTVSYPREGRFTGAELSGKLLETYDRLSNVKNNYNFIVNFSDQTDTAGSAVIRALVDVHKKVTLHKGAKLVCSAFPEDFLPSLGTLGITNLPNFRLALNLRAALNYLGVAAEP